MNMKQKHDSPMYQKWFLSVLYDDFIFQPKYANKCMAFNHFLNGISGTLVSHVSVSYSFKGEGKPILTDSELRLLF
jgi:hypothetical protein